MIKKLVIETIYIITKMTKKKDDLKGFMTKVSRHGSNLRMCGGIMCDKRDHYLSAHVNEFANNMKKINKKKQIIGKGVKPMTYNEIRVF